MNSEKDDAEFAAKVVSHMSFDQENTDEELSKRLAEMRRTALDHIPEEASVKKRQVNWLPAGVLSGVATLLIAVFIVLPSSDENVEDMLTQEMLNTLEMEDDMDLLENDLEFYLWVEQQG